MRPVEGVLIVVTVILDLFIQLNQQRFVIFRLMYERWAEECSQQQQFIGIPYTDVLT